MNRLIAGGSRPALRIAAGLVLGSVAACGGAGSNATDPGRPPATYIYVAS